MDHRTAMELVRQITDLGLGVELVAFVEGGAKPVPPIQLDRIIWEARINIENAGVEHMSRVLDVLKRAELEGEVNYNALVVPPR